MKSIFAIDPGPTESGWVSYLPAENRVLESGILRNQEMIWKLEDLHPCHRVIEMIACYGMPVGKEVFETCVWIGRFTQASDRFGGKMERVTRLSCKLNLCHSPRAKDSNVRQAILDRFEPLGGGKTPQVGTKSKPGPLYGVKSHAWAALAVAITFAHRGNGPATRIQVFETED